MPLNASLRLTMRGVKITMSLTIEFASNQAYLKKPSSDVIFLSSGLGALLEEMIPQSESPIHKGSNFITALHAPDSLQKAHELYLNAGADIITTDTFCGSYYRQAGNIELTNQFVEAAVKVAQISQTSVSHKTLMAISLTSLEDCYDPEATPALSILKKEHQNNLTLLEQYGDFTLAETLPTLREAQVIAEYTTRPFAVSFVVSENGQVLDGSSMRDVVETVLEPYGLCLGIGVNCCTLEGAEAAVKALKEVYEKKPHLVGKHIIAYPNGFVSSQKENSQCSHNHSPTKLSPKTLSTALERLVSLGATTTGGCCGAGPEHTQAYVQNISRTP